MQRDVILWITVAAVVCGLAAFVVWRGRNVGFRMSRKGVEFKTSDAKDHDTDIVKVGEGAKVGGEFAELSADLAPTPEGRMTQQQRLAKRWKLVGRLTKSSGLK
jgi:hypothetical protein